MGQVLLASCPRGPGVGAGGLWGPLEVLPGQQATLGDTGFDGSEPEALVSLTGNRCCVPVPARGSRDELQLPSGPPLLPGPCGDPLVHAGGVAVLLSILGPCLLSPQDELGSWRIEG